jgi:hypothetical protein
MARSKTCPALVTGSWVEDEEVVLQECEPNVESCNTFSKLKPQQIVLRADAKPFYPEESSLKADAKPFYPEDMNLGLKNVTEDAMASTNCTEAQELMQQLHESLKDVCEWSTPRKAVAPCLHVPCNTPAAALYSHDSSPCRFGVATNSFAMGANIEESA